MGYLYIWSGDVRGLVKYLDPGVLSSCQYWQAGVVSNPDYWQPVENWTCSETQALWWQHKQKHPGPDIIICGDCYSALDVAWRLAFADCLGPWDSVLCITQWAGRGQLQRSWSSPPGNIYAALYCPKLEAFPQTCLPVLLGFCLVKAFREQGCCLSLKWPNDLILNRKKVAGILLEQKREITLAGIGVNLNRLPEPSRITGNLEPGCLKGFQGVQNPVSYWQKLVRRVVLWYRLVFENFGLEEIAKQVEEVMEFIGENVWIRSSSEGIFSAQVVGLDSNLGLRIKKNAREQVLYNASLLVT